MHICKITVFCLFIFFGHCVCADNYRILITNDDGIESPLLIALADALAADYDVTVSAPRENQSGSSHASSSSIPLVVEKIYRNNAFFGYAVHGRPADAARFGILNLGAETPFDLVVSGINRGANVGNVAHLSGTVGAAMEGLYQGIPSLAVSQDAQANPEISIDITQQVIEHIRAKGLASGIMLSINVPAGEVKQVLVKPMGGSYLTFGTYTIAEQTENSTTYSGSLYLTTTKEKNDNDTRAYQEGAATITPLKLDWTDKDMIKAVESWNVKIQ